MFEGGEWRSPIMFVKESKSPEGGVVLEIEESHKTVRKTSTQHSYFWKYFKHNTLLLRRVEFCGDFVHSELRNLD